MKRISAGLLLTTILMLSAGSAYAVPITTWQVDVDTRFDTATVNPAGITIVNDQSLRWGSSTGSGQSGLDITNSPATTYVDTNGPSVPKVDRIFTLSRVVPVIGRFRCVMSTLGTEGPLVST